MFEMFHNVWALPAPQGRTDGSVFEEEHQRIFLTFLQLKKYRQAGVSDDTLVFGNASND